LANNNTHAAKSALKSIKGEIDSLGSDSNPLNQYDQIRESLLWAMRLSSDLSNTLEKKQMAEIIITRFEGLAERRSALIDADLLEAFLGAERCSDFQRLAEKLSNRGYTLEFSKQLMEPCFPKIAAQEQ